MENKNEYYLHILEEITNHADFQKKNPVDIGLECGYQEKEVEKAILMCYSIKKDCSNKEDTYYFVLKRGETSISVAIIDAVNWTEGYVKDIKDVRWYEDIIRMKGSVLAYVSMRSKKKIIWENFETGKSGEFLAPAIIKDLMVLENSVIALVENKNDTYDFVRFTYDGNVEQHPAPKNSLPNMRVVTGEQRLIEKLWASCKYEANSTSEEDHAEPRGEVMDTFGNIVRKSINQTKEMSKFVEKIKLM